MGTLHAKRNFKSVHHKVCCSEHFRPTDFKVGFTGHRRQLKKESIPSLFKWAPEKVTLRGECLNIQTENISHAQKEEAKHSMEKNLQHLDSPMPLRSCL